MRLQQDIDDENNLITQPNNQIEFKREHNYFINHDNFERLKKLQQEIYNTLDVSIKIRKLANLLITEENIQNLKSQLLDQFKL